MSRHPSSKLPSRIDRVCRSSRLKAPVRLRASAQGKEMFKTLRYYWNTARGYRLKPWKSPYLRWRFETFLGKEAADLTARKFFHLTWKYREHLERFVDWAAERRRLEHRHHA